MNGAYKIKTPTFDGPLELLLSLIEKRKLFINDISLSDVAEDYFSRVKGLEQFPIAETANFLIVAATLILIKSRSLLPELKLTEGEEGDIDDLKKRLQLYKIFKERGEIVKKNLYGAVIWGRPFKKSLEPIFSPDKNFSVTNIKNTIKDVISRIPSKVVLPKAIVKKVISIEEMIGRLSERVKTEMETSFKKLLGQSDKPMDKDKKIYMIVGFLALLELVKQGMISVSQNEAFQDIAIGGSKPTKI